MLDEKSKILLCEENENLGVIISEYLKSKNFQVDLFFDREKAYESFIEIKHTICILDITLFENDGFELIDKIHETNPQSYIIFLSPKGAKATRPYVPNETYIPKPFSINDLMSVMKFKTRSTQRNTKGYKKIYEPANITVHNIGKFRYEEQRRKLILDDKTIDLTSRESALLTILCENPNTILERDFIIEKIWNYDGDYYGKSRTMDVYICKLRNYLRGDERINLINVHTKGYKLIIPTQKPQLQE
ncbi:MAG: response regulator transcription factor [Paludibacter sp.]